MTEQLYNALGRLSVAFSELEDRLKDLLASLIHQDKRTVDILTYRMSFFTLCEVLNAMFHDRVDDSELLAFFDELMPQVDDCRIERNKYVHSSWYTQEPSIPYIRAETKIRKGKYKDNWEVMGSGDILELTKCVEETATGVFELLMHMHHKGITDMLADTFAGLTFPEGLPRHFKARKKPTKT